MDCNLRKELRKLENGYSYEDTVRLGYYSRNPSEAKSSKTDDLDRKVRFDLNGEVLPGPQRNRISHAIWRIRKNIGCRLRYLGMLLSDWAFLAVLGVVVACLSILVDGMIYSVQKLHIHAMSISAGPSSALWLNGISLLAWCIYTVGLVAASASFVHFVSPQAIGSGIPEMKTIIRGVVLKDYLTLRTLVSKIFGVALSLGSGVPIGKMGPFVHIASVVADQLSRLASRYDAAFSSESRRVECLAAACAVGVACTFSAPVGGVLFSIEVTTMYFSVRSYWRGFFAACCGATTIRLLRGFVAQTEVTVNAFYQTSFLPDAFSVHELPLFALLGLICGILGAWYISLYRSIVLFLRKNGLAKRIFQQHWIVYPVVISLIYAIISFPHGLGMYTTGRLKFGMNLRDFFTNCTFTALAGDRMACHSDVYQHWIGSRDETLTLLSIFILIHIVFSLLCMTLPVPSGVFGPVFVLGAAIGRLMGELVAIALPHGIIDGLVIYPGIYAVVGAAAFSASVTHTVSVAVMIFEITGQLHFILPVMISVVISNAVCAYMQPSFFDTIIKIKHLPFLPDIPPSSNMVHTTYAEDIMQSPVMFITRMTSYASIRSLLVDTRNLRILPVVDTEENQMLIGTVSRRLLLELLEEQVGDEARHEEAERRVRRAIETIDEHYQSSQMQQLTNKMPRTLSESNISADSVRVRQRRESEVNGETTDVQRKASRFLVVPTAEPPFPSPRASPLPVRRRNSLSQGRRNAFCSLAAATAAANKEAEVDSTYSTIDGKHHSLHAHSYQAVVKSYLKQAKKYLHSMQFGHTRKEGSHENLYDLSPDERAEWERERLEEMIQLDDVHVDPAPFQLVKKTSLFRIHSIFSMLQLNKAYVTDCGRLIGVVALSDVRVELERSQAEREEVAGWGSSSQKRPLARGGLKKKNSSSAVVDILTPTLEVIRPTALLILEESRPVVTSNPEEGFGPRKTSSLRVPPHHKRSDVMPPRPRDDEQLDETLPPPPPEVYDISPLPSHYVQEPLDRETIQEILDNPQAMGSLEKLISHMDFYRPPEYGESYKFIRMADDLHDVASYMNDLRICFIAVTVTGYILLAIYLIVLCMRRNRRNQQPRRRNWDYQLESQRDFGNSNQNTADEVTTVRETATPYSVGRNHHRAQSSAAPSFMRHGHMNHQQTTRLMAETDGAVVKHHHQIPHITTDPPLDEKSANTATVPQLVKDSMES